MLELREHNAAAWLTLTYEERYKPPTLSKPHLSGYLKRLRSRVEPQRIKFFGVGEYGEQTERPHYHVILYGLDRGNRHLQDAWPFGHVRAEPVTPRNIAYTAGYAQKKITRASHRQAQEEVDPETGEVYRFQAPFRLVSRGGKSGCGIGSAARRHRNSWRRSALWRSAEVPVPRYLHLAWKDLATPGELEALAQEKAALPSMSLRERRAAEEIAIAKYREQSSRRTLR